MMDTSRKIAQEEIVLLDEFQLHLQRRGIASNQKRLIEESIRFSLEHEEQFVQRLQKKKDNTKEMTERFLQQAKKFDFGKDWLEEIDISL